MIDGANHAFVDRYSVPHAALGIVFQASRISPALAIGSHVAFEAVEDDIKHALRHVWPDARPDGMENHVGDVACFTVGYAAGAALAESETGKVLLTAFVALGAGIWAWSLLNRRTPFSP